MIYSDITLSSMFVKPDIFEDIIKDSELNGVDFSLIKSNHYMRTVNIDDYVMIKFYKNDNERDRLRLLHDVLRLDSISLTPDKSGILLSKELIIKYSRYLSRFTKCDIYREILEKEYPNLLNDDEKYSEDITVALEKYSSKEEYIQAINDCFREHSDMIKGIVVSSKNIVPYISTDNLICNNELFGHTIPLENKICIPKLNSVFRALEDKQSLDKALDGTLLDVFSYINIPVDCIDWVINILKYRKLLSIGDGIYEFR